MTTKTVYIKTALLGGTTNSVDGINGGVINKVEAENVAEKQETDYGNGSRYSSNRNEIKGN